MTTYREIVETWSAASTAALIDGRDARMQWVIDKDRWTVLVAEVAPHLIVDGKLDPTITTLLGEPVLFEVGAQLRLEPRAIHATP